MSGVSFLEQGSTKATPSVLSAIDPPTGFGLTPPPRLRHASVTLGDPLACAPLVRAG